MGSSLFGRLACAALALGALGGCGGHKTVGASPFPAKVTLSPTPSTSVQQGSIFTFSASAQNVSNSNISPTFTFQSSDTSILNIAPNGLACAGRWDAAFTTCTPMGTGAVQVTVSALGATSPPTVVFVHAPIDKITVTEAPPSQVPPPTPEPCVVMGQTTRLQATAWSQNADITSTVGPFTWSAANSGVVSITPLMNSAFNVATNQATAVAATPGLTQIYASASGVSSSAFTQAAFPTLNFFETCPVQSITLQLGVPGSLTGQTTFNTTKGTAQPVIATVVDVFGNTLSKVPLTWSASAPATVSGGTGCSSLTCSISTAQPGAGSVTASCSPPTCNIGFPLTPAGLPTAFVPLPVYATTAISGVVSGPTTSTNVLATSLDCQGNFNCTTYLYNIATSKNLAASPNAMPAPPNSLVLDLAGDKAYAGSNYGAFLVTTGTLGGTSNPFISFGTVTGTVLAVSPNGNVALISDTLHTPNQVFVVNTTSSSSPSATALNINGAITAGFSPDGLKAYIIGCVVSSVPCTSTTGNALYVYSALQSLQGPIALSVPASQVAFSPNGAFGYVSGAPSGNPPALTAFNICDNQVAKDVASQLQQIIPLTATPAFVKTIPNAHLEGSDNAGKPFLDGMHLLALGNTGIDVITGINTVTAPVLANPPNPVKSCPQSVTHPVPVQHIDLGQGTFNPVAFFVSPDATQAYIVASDRSDILVYNFNTGSVSGIPLAGNATPGDPANPMRTVADITVDGTLIYVAGSDGALHEVSTNPSVDLVQISFPNLPNVSNPFCSIGNCKLNMVAVKP
jgi:hypothetical protein